MKERAPSVGDRVVITKVIGTDGKRYPEYEGSGKVYDVESTGAFYVELDGSAREVLVSPDFDEWEYEHVSAKTVRVPAKTVRVIFGNAVVAEHEAPRAVEYVGSWVVITKADGSRAAYPAAIVNQVKEEV